MPGSLCQGCACCHQLGTSSLALTDERADALASLRAVQGSDDRPRPTCLPRAAGNSPVGFGRLPWSSLSGLYPNWRGPTFSDCSTGTLVVRNSQMNMEQPVTWPSGWVLARTPCGAHCVSLILIPQLQPPEFAYLLEVAEARCRRVNSPSLNAGRPLAESSARVISLRSRWLMNWESALPLSLGTFAAQSAPSRTSGPQKRSSVRIARARKSDDPRNCVDVRIAVTRTMR